MSNQDTVCSWAITVHGPLIWQRAWKKETHPLDFCNTHDHFTLITHSNCIHFINKAIYSSYIDCVHLQMTFRRQPLITSFHHTPGVLWAGYSAENHHSYTEGYGDLLDCAFQKPGLAKSPTATQPRVVGCETGHLTHPRRHGLEQDPGCCLRPAQCPS